MDSLKIFVEDTAGNKYECNLSPSIVIGRLAADFFDQMGWSKENKRQRAVVELVLGKLRKNKRLKSEHTLETAKIKNGSTLRIFPESIAGVDARERRATLAADLRDIEILCEDNDLIDFEAKPSSLPTKYIFEFYYESFSSRPENDTKPKISRKHKAEIDLPASYPLEAPKVRWKTPIFHPNIRKSDGAVCLGQLMERYLPSFGLGNIVSMLIEMLQWKNYDPYHSFDPEALRWSTNPKNWKYIEQIGGSPFQIPWTEVINPENWGPNAHKDSIFRGMEQPERFRKAWEEHQQRELINFRPIN